jgi:hypothetical protein
MKVRNTARIIVINPAGAVLLVRANDSTPVNPDEPTSSHTGYPRAGE